MRGFIQLFSTAVRYRISCTAVRYRISCTAVRYRISCTAVRYRISCTAPGTYRRPFIRYFKPTNSTSNITSLEDQFIEG